MCDRNMHREANLVLIHPVWTAVPQKLRAGVVGCAAAAILLLVLRAAARVSVCVGLHFLLQCRHRCSRERIVSGSVLVITGNDRPAALDTTVVIWKLYERLHRNNVIREEVAKDTVYYICR